jgi:CBS domain-containing protein
MSSDEKISDLKLNKPLFIKPREHVYTAAKILSDNDTGIVLLSLNEDDCLGVLSERDIVRGIGQKGAKFLENAVGDISLLPPILVDIDEKVSVAINIMVSKKIRHLVIRSNDRVVGVLGASEVFKHLRKDTSFDFFS